MMPASPSSSRRCDGIRRRDFLHVGLLTTLGLSVSDLLRWQVRAMASEPARKTAHATSCILIWLDGGPSHLDTFDLKPDAPAEIRSPFTTIPTGIAGIHLCEHLPRTAKVMREVALIRSLTHELGNHDTGARFLLTGHRPTPAFEHPSLGSLIAHGAGPGGTMPPYVAIPGDNVGGQSTAARAGYLPGAFSAFNVGNDPGRVRDLDLPEGVSFDRSERRRDLLHKLDSPARSRTRRPRAIATPFTNRPTGSCRPQRREEPSTFHKSRRRPGPVTAPAVSARGVCWRGGVLRLARASSRWWIPAGTRITKSRANCPTHGFLGAVSCPASTTPTPLCSPTCASVAYWIPHS